ncbi:MAG: glycoside hydrolase family 31 protein [Flavobacteriaceae bacterium]|nr:glycoside hydrolase family 31 protein [Flavobacteriaceae bacterium]
MKKILLFLFGISLAANPLFSQNAERTFIGSKFDKTGVFINVSDGEYRISYYNKNIVETTFIPKGQHHIENSHAVVLKPLEVPFKSSENQRTVVMNSDGITVSIDKTPFKINYFYKNRPLISEKKGYIKTDSLEIIEFNLNPKEVLYGGGARALGMNRRGHRLTLYNRAHYGYETQSALMNFTLPLVLSSSLYAIHFDNAPIGFLDLNSKKNNTLAYQTISGRKTYQVIAGSDWDEITDQYTSLTGRQPIPPRWVFGNFSSRFGYHSEKEVRATVRKFAEEQIPLDAVVIDIYWFGKDIQGHMGNLEFLKDSFPNPELMISDFQKNNIKTILVTEPFILTSSKKWKEASENNYLGKDNTGKPFTYDFYFGNTGLVDIFNPKAVDWFWNIYKELTQMGVQGWWGDLGEPEVHPSAMFHETGTADEVHNIYGHEWAKMIYDGYRRDFPDQRPFILMRAGYSGSQRFGLIPWSGDVSRSWGGLQSQPEIALQMGMQGLAYMHSDLGGFGGGEKFDPELYTRWLQYGVFQPVFRPHAQEHIAPEPVFHDEKTKSLAKKSIELRYALLPYNYTLAFENNQSGRPFMRPLFFEEPGNESLYNRADCYFWGENFLVRPILESGIKTVEMQFPNTNNWFDFYTDQPVRKGKSYTIDVKEDHIPVFVRGGAFIPMAKPMQNTEAYTLNDLMVHFYFDAETKTSDAFVFNDDGKTP